ncbi:MULTISPECIES: RNA-guided endonuclease InsQ/TnpB family protein [unclassified Streptomyces]|uniref:RNA-guided endonuclease InsQ/TnpB family protein n=1 Tax=unclassified Streptomyces TaxID=2593676 RepID=UPI00237A819C|nr:MULTISPECIES: transposase [unclassified Streptomyces]
MGQEIAYEKRQFGHRARLALTPAQVRLMDDQGHAARTTWNLLHDFWTMTPKYRRDLKAADEAIRQARKEIDWLGVLPAQAAQAVLKTYFQAWKNCWEGRADEPNFKARIRTPLTVDVPQGRDLNIVRINRRWGEAQIPKIGRVRFRWTRDLPIGKRADTDNRITGARLVKDSLGWHIAFRVQTREAVPAPHTGPEIGIDFGVNLPLALSDGNHQDHSHAPRLPDGTADRDKWLTEKEKTVLLRLEQHAARLKQHRKRGEKFSGRLRAVYRRIGRLRATATRRATDWQHQTTTMLARTYGVIVVEDLHITNMTKSAKGTIEEPGRNVAAKAGLNRSIAQEAWGRTMTMLGYKTARNGGTLVKVPAPYTSQRCHACGLVTPGSREDQATFVCKNSMCGWTGNADENAARNILHLYRIGHTVVIPAAGRAVVRRRKPSNPPAQARRESPSFTTPLGNAETGLVVRLSG